MLFLCVFVSMHVCIHGIYICAWVWVCVYCVCVNVCVLGLTKLVIFFFDVQIQD